MFLIMEKYVDLEDTFKIHFAAKVVKDLPKHETKFVPLNLPECKAALEAGKTIQTLETPHGRIYGIMVKVDDLVKLAL